MNSVDGTYNAAYTDVIGSRTDHVRGPCTAVYSLYTAEGGRVHGP